MHSMTEAKPKPVTVTLSHSTRLYLAAKAKDGFRSLNKELAMRIEESCARDLAVQAKEAQHEKQA